VPPGTEYGTFFAPQVREINGVSIFAGEVFGPILHIVRWRADRLDRVLDEIAATGYGLTLGIHSRVDEPHPRAPQGRQQLRQPEHDRRRRRRAAVPR
jgi:delta 1-pyrroline-5-carboxylate dehydrogenase